MHALISVLWQMHANVSAANVVASPSRAGTVHRYLCVVDGVMGCFSLYRPAAPAMVTNVHIPPSCVGSAQVYEWGLLFRGVNHRLPGDGQGQQQALVGMAERLERNEYLRRIVMRSEAAYLSNRDVADVSAEGIGGGGGHADASSTSSASITTSGATVSAHDVLRTRVYRLIVPRPRLAASLAGVVVSSVACGYAHSIAIDRTGRIWACGYNDRGQLGLGNRLASAEYKPVNARAVVSEAVVGVACGQQHNLAYTRTGNVFSWGSGALGQLGLGTITDMLEPTLVDTMPADDNRVVGVACGSNHSLVLTTAGLVYGFGHSEYNQMGDSVAGADLVHTSRHYFVPRLIDGLRNVRVRKIAAGGQFSLALVADGSCVSWGWDAYNCLGRGEDPDNCEATFARVAGAHGRIMQDIACGYTHALACATQDGHAYAAQWLSLFRAVNKDVVSLVTTIAPSAVPEGAMAAGGIVVRTGVVSGAVALAESRIKAAPVDAKAYAVDDDAEAWLESEPFDRTLLDGDCEDDAAAGAFAGVLLPDVDFVAVEARTPVIHKDASSTEAAASVLSERHSGGSGKVGSTSTDTANTSYSTDLSGVTAVAGPAPPVPRVSTNAAVASFFTDARNKLLAALAPPSVIGSIIDSKKVDEKLEAADAIALHAAFVVSRCPLIGVAMLQTRQAADAVCAVDSSPPPAPVQLTVPNTRACASVTIAYSPATHKWAVRFEGAKQVVLYALGAYLYSDVLVHIPPHRVPQLRSLAQALQLNRLVALCDAVMHEYDVEALGGMVTERATASGSLRDSTFISDMRDVLRRGLLSDVLFNVPRITDASPGRERSSDAEARCHPSTRFAAHSAVLCRAEYFSKLLTGGFRESTSSLQPSAADTCASGCGSDSGIVATVSRCGGPVDLLDMDATVFAAVLDYMYTGDLQPFTVDAELCMQTLAVASQLCIPDLIAKLQDVIMQRMSAEDAPVCMEFASTYGLHRLLKFAEAFGTCVPAVASY